MTLLKVKGHGLLRQWGMLLGQLVYDSTYFCD